MKFHANMFKSRVISCGRNHSMATLQGCRWTQNGRILTFRGFVPGVVFVLNSIMYSFLLLLTRNE